MNGSATIGELKEFLGTIKGRNPQEVIGIVSSSLLIQSLVVATVGTIIGMAIFTVVPYMLYGPLKSGPTAAKPAAAAPADNGKAEPIGDKPEKSATANAASSEPDPEKAAKVLGIDETKGADPSKNPLDSPDFDKLLDGK